MSTPATEVATYPRPDISELLHVSAGRLRILDAAAEAFMERGYDATTVDEIADRMGATKGAIYYSFRSKMDIFVAVYERGMLQLEQRAHEALTSSAGAPSGERLRSVSIAHALNIMRNYAYHVVIQNGVEQRRQMALKDRERTRLGQLDEMRTDHEALVESLILDGHRDGSIRQSPARLATRTLIGGIVGIAIWYRPRTGQTEAERLELAEQVVDILLAGFLSQ